jgi:PIN domain nuclease of toxin-antitoxin system
MGSDHLPMGLDHASEVERLQPIHRDPFDRLLLVQARVDDPTLITSDREVRRYPASVVF